MTKQLYGYDPTRMGIPVSTWTGKFEALLVCPFHNDHSPSLSFNVVSGSFYCFSCGMAGGPDRLAKAFGGSSKRVKIKAHRFEKEKSDNWRVLFSGEIAVNNPYLLNRGVTNEQITRHSISSNRHGVVIPIRNASRNIVGAVLRHYTKKPKYLYFGKRPGLWWASSLPEEKDVFVVEGVCGVLNAERAGVPAVTTLSAMVKWTARSQLNKFNPYVLFDDDMAGYLGAWKLMKLCPTARVIVPGREADELSSFAWRNLWVGRDQSSTRNLFTIANYTYDKELFLRKVKR